MADGLNSVHLLGNMGADPEFRITATSQPVLKIRLATSSSYLDRNKVRQERTEWHNVVVWGKRAEALSRILGKGSRIFVSGELRTSKYEVNGEQRYKTEIVAGDIILCGGRGRGSGSSQQHDEERHDYPRGDDEGGGEDDIPF